MTIHRPNADLANSGWSPSTGSEAYAVVDESVTDDADYISTTSAGSVKDLALPVTALSDTNTIKYRAAIPEADRGLSVELRERQAPVIITSKQPWRQQPQVPVGIDLNNPITYGLKHWQTGMDSNAWTNVSSSAARQPVNAFPDSSTRSRSSRTTSRRRSRPRKGASRSG